MPLETCRLGKAFGAGGALEWFLASVHSQVGLKLKLLKERLWALGTLEGFYTPHSPQVRLKVCVLDIGPRAVVAFVRLYSCVGSQVMVEIRRAMKTLQSHTRY